MQAKYNTKSPAVKRLMREALELSQPTPQYYAQPLEDNLFEWHFTVSGPADSEFEGGRYHGRVILPPEYPMKPPSIILLTPNGRFEIGKKICLSMSAHHPETWQPSWSIRTVLLALIGFMPTKGGGAIGAVDYTPQERKKLAIKSQQWQCDACGVHSCTALAQADETSTDKADKEAQELASQIDFKGEQEKKDGSDKSKSAEAGQPAAAAQPESTPDAADPSSNQPRPDGPTSTASSSSQPGSAAQGGQEPAPVVRRRLVSAAVVANAATRTESTGSSTDPGYCTLVMMWIVAAALVVLIIRRLCLDTINVQQT